MTIILWIVYVAITVILFNAGITQKENLLDKLSEETRKRIEGDDDKKYIFSIFLISLFWLPVIIILVLLRLISKFVNWIRP